MRDYEEMLAVFKAGFRARFDAPGLLRPEGDEAIRAGIAAVIRALRDEMQFGDWTAWHRLNEILGDAGEKVAGVSTREDESADGLPRVSAPDALATPATDPDPKQSDHTEYMNETMPMKVADPAPDVCEWTRVEWTPLMSAHWTAECSDRALWSPDWARCPSCGKPIKFTEAK